MDNAYPGLPQTIFFLFKLLFNYVNWSDHRVITSPPYPLTEVPKRYFLYNSPLQTLYGGMGTSFRHNDFWDCYLEWIIPTYY